MSENHINYWTCIENWRLKICNNSNQKFLIYESANIRNVGKRDNMRHRYNYTGHNGFA